MIRWIRNFFSNWQVAYYEVLNWIFVIKTIRKHKQTADWQNYNLRTDWIGRVYTVINPQSPGDDGDTDEVLRIKFAERLKPINLYLDNLGLSESVYPAYENIAGTKSYLFVYTPIFRVITLGKVFLFLLAIAVFFLTQLDSITWNGILWVIEKIQQLIPLIF